MKTVLFVLATTIASLLSPCWGQTEDCKPRINCNPPNCRCWDDGAIPGGIVREETPQVVLITFEYALNAGNVDFYTSLFEGTKNPNGCPAVGTFYVQKTSSDMGLVKGLADIGHEIGVTSVDGTSPETTEEWRGSIAEVKKAVVGSGVLASSVIGVRAPELMPGGLQQFTALGLEGFLYDASCTTSIFDDRGNLLWPYTYDFAPGPACDNGEGPEQAFPGKWQVMIADLEFNGTKCASPSACTKVETQRDAFDLFYNSFIQHYEGGRSPFVVAVNPDWVTIDFKRAGTQQFIEYIRAAFPDTWILTVTQSLQWIRDPVPNANATADYPAWSCL